MNNILIVYCALYFTSSFLLCATSHLSFTINLRGRCYYPHRKGVKLRHDTTICPEEKASQISWPRPLNPPPPQQFLCTSVRCGWRNSFPDLQFLSSLAMWCPLTWKGPRCRWPQAGCVEFLGTWRPTPPGLTSAAPCLTPVAANTQLSFPLAFPHWAMLISQSSLKIAWDSVCEAPGLY